MVGQAGAGGQRAVQYLAVVARRLTRAWPARLLLVAGADGNWATWLDCNLRTLRMHGRYGNHLVLAMCIQYQKQKATKRAMLSFFVNLVQLSLLLMPTIRP